MKIIVPVDFSSNAINALELAIQIADRKHGQIKLVHVIELVYDFASQAAVAIESMYKDGEKQLNALIQNYASHEVNMSYQLMEGNPAVNIARIAEEEQATLIVMGTQGASGINKILIGSTAVNVIKEAHCPVLIVPAKAQLKALQKVTLALEFANHEEPFIDWLVEMAQRWQLGLEFLHVQTQKEFQNKLIVLGLEKYLEKKYPQLPVKIHTFYASTAAEGLESYLDEHDNTMLVMCHQHKNLWKQILQKSESIAMAYHTHIPLLIMH
ncbi:universal stress protein [Algoriphagus confluentis]|uniref:Universal stress protein n=1 Tax=Algoriphagus confluentis TaxID=1697556 RepID=A0ABQ6PJQ1_9BACT|nr:universal stress protein [Algoriphagus confluentis]